MSGQSLATVAELRNKRGERIAVLFPGDADSVVDETLASAILEASQRARSYLLDRYRDHLSTVTAATCPLPLKNAILHMAWLTVADDSNDFASEVDRQNARDAVDYLAQVSKGAATLEFAAVTSADITSPDVLSAEPATSIRDFWAGGG